MPNTIRVNLRIVQLDFGLSLARNLPSAHEVLLTWDAQPGHKCMLQSSHDLVTWRNENATINEIKPGWWEAKLPAQNEGSR